MVEKKTSTATKSQDKQQRVKKLQIETRLHGWKKQTQQQKTKTSSKGQRNSKWKPGFMVKKKQIQQQKNQDKQQRAKKLQMKTRLYNTQGLH